MEIRLEAGEKRRFCYIDRYENYMTLSTKSAELNEGLVYKNQSLFFDFAIFAKRDGFLQLNSRYENTSTSVRPDSFSVRFYNEDSEVKCALFENCLYFDMRKFDAEKCALVVLPSIDLGKKLDKGNALASDCEIEVRRPLVSELLQLTRVFGKRAASARIMKLSGRGEIYISLEHSPSSSSKAAARMLRENAFLRHCDEVNAMLGKSEFKSGNPKIDDAMKWAKFSSLQFLNGNKTRALWAGLPWFRDYWGRDIFTSIPGTLLLSANYAEAEALFENFVQYQDTNPHSVTYGRLPNIYRSSGDILYNTADATLLFTREVLDTARWTGSKKFLEKMWPHIHLALECDRKLRTDSSGFLLHGDADTWMDARIFGEKSFSPRGNRAVDIQVLWWTALECGAEIAELLGKKEEQSVWKSDAAKIKNSFPGKFFDGKRMADCIMRDDTADFRVRPNQLILITAAQITGQRFISEETENLVAKNALGELLFSYGLCSLSQRDRYFHPYHGTSELYHEDAAYHNGTIWTWNASWAIGALCATGRQNLAWAFAKNVAGQLMDYETAGTLSANISAYPADDGTLMFSGAYSSCRSNAEFFRSIWQHFLGLRVDLLKKKIRVSPQFPSEWNEGSACIELGAKNSFSLEIRWSNAAQDGSRRMEFEFSKNAPGLFLEIQFEDGLKTINIKGEGLYSAEGKNAVAEKNDISFCQPDCFKENWKKPECLSQKNFLAEICLRQEFNPGHPSSLTAIRS